MNFNKKLRLIYFHFLVIAVSFILVYTLLHWLLVIQLNSFHIKEDIVKFWLPFILVWIPVLIWLRPRLKLLKLTGGNGNLPALYLFMAAMAIAAPAIVAQHYLTKASGKRTVLENVNQITTRPSTKYYSIKSYYVDKSHPGIHTAFDVSGKGNANFNMHIYIVLPVLQEQNDTNSTTCSAWVGIQYSKRISNNLGEKEKQDKYLEFANESEMKFENTDVQRFVYLEKVEYSDELDGYIEAVKKNDRYHESSAPVFNIVDAPFEKRTGNLFVWIFGAFAIGAIVWLIMILIPKIDEAQMDRQAKGVAEADDELKEFFIMFKPRKGFFITPWLMYANILVYLLMVFSGLGFLDFKVAGLLSWGANYGPVTTGGEWWRLLTNIFLHGGIMHLLANMYGLLFVGIFLEPVLGSTRFLVFYLITGIIGSVASIWWYDATVSVGASGAIFGVYGIFLALLLTKVFPPAFGKAFLVSTLVFIGFNLIMGLTGGIDNAAHIGGLLSGFLFGFLLSPVIKRHPVNTGL